MTCRCFQGLGFFLQIRNFGFEVFILFAVLDRFECFLRLFQLFVQFLLLFLGADFCDGDARRIHRTVLIIDDQRLIIGVSELLHVAVLLCIAVGSFDEALLVVELQRLKIGLRLLQLVRFLRL